LLFFQKTDSSELKVALIWGASVLTLWFNRLVAFVIEIKKQPELLFSRTHVEN
jgi:hypothetical protein